MHTRTYNYNNAFGVHRLMWDYATSADSLFR